MSVIESRTALVENGTNGHRPDGDRLRTFLAAGVDLAGTTGKDTRALLMGDTAYPFRGTAADWAALRTLVQAADEFAQRAMSERERTKVAAAVLAAVHRVDENLASGLGVRRDDFFAATRARRAAADEAAEVALLAAQREPEEAKLPFLGNLLANLAFREGTDRAQSVALLRLATGLSYRQLGLLAVFSHTERLDLRTSDYHGQGRVPFAAVSVLQEAFELVRMSLVVQTTGDPITLRDFTPGKVTVAGVGAVLVKAMGLNGIDPEAIDTLAALLR